MGHNQERFQAQASNQDAPVVLVAPLSALERAHLALVGGKAANLGELIRAGFPVPEGFCVTTAAYALMSASAGVEPLVAELAQLPDSAGERLDALAAAIHTAVLQAPAPVAVAAALASAYHGLGGRAVPVAVRSSATAEDLPGASFAGQHETALQVVGAESLLAALQRCWASLWSERAVRYRARLGIDPRAVRLAVVVQRMVDAQVAGVLFTANPLTGKRRQAILDASPGLGEAVAAGATTPDHFIVDTPAGAISERHIGGKQLEIRPVAGGGTRRVERLPQPQVCLSDAQVLALAALGARVEAHFGTPQDIEWALDSAGQCWLLQARPITTLFPLPAGAPAADAELRVYLCFNAQQGSTRPFTPIGISALRRIASAIAAMAGAAPPSPAHGPGFVTEAASRLFFDVTAALRHPVGRRILTEALADAEAQAVAGFRRLVADPRLSLLPASPRAFALAAARLLVRSRMPWYLLQALLAPQAAQARAAQLERQLRAEAALERPLSPDDALRAAERLLAAAPALLFQISPLMLASMLSFALAGRLLGELATEAERQVVLQGTPGNPTVAMNQALAELAQQVRAEAPAARLLQATPPAQLAAAYREGALPAVLQRGLARFLQEYGHRSVDELDLGVARWAEAPDYLLSVLAGYLPLRDADQPPGRQLRRAAAAGEAMVVELTRRAAQHSLLRGLLVGICLRRARALGGARELPRSILALMLARVRALLRPAGIALAKGGQLARGDDVVFLTLPEVAAALAGADLRATVRDRRASYAEERGRRPVPLVLLSDGTEPTDPAPQAEPHGQILKGTAAASGRASGLARVLHDPHGAQLLPGEILVAPATDPGWTPLFLSASGLVMELGGAMAHGAIIAREYGLPAVVGVAGATTRIATGSRITVDGTRGTVTIEGSGDAVREGGGGRI
jgi:phosphohistidine swiveling domain-containing protein